MAGAGSVGAAGPAAAPAARRTEILTSVAALGTAVGTGTVLYSADGEPVVAIVSDQVLWRDLDVDSADGADVTTVEQALVDLGYGDVTVDDAFDSDTAAAVAAWESDLGRADPDGVVSVDDLVTVPAGVSVTGVESSPGNSVGPGSDILDLAAGEREVVVDVPADETGPWRDGDVSLELSDGSVHDATVTSVGTDVTIPADGAGRGTVEVVVVATDGSEGLTTGTATEVTAVVESAPAVLTVPVSALVEYEGEPALRVVGRGIVPVTYGLLVDGLAEVLGGVADADVVAVPGTE